MTQETKQTAVEWLIQKIDVLGDAAYTPEEAVKIYGKQALQMEKEQSFTEDDVRAAYYAGYADAQTNHINDAKNYIHELRYIRNEPNID